MNKRVIIQYTLAGIIVLILGGLTGWYVFLRTQTNRTAAQDSARGFGSAAPVGNAGSGAGTSAGGTGNTYGGIGGSNSGSLSPAGPGGTGSATDAYVSPTSQTFSSAAGTGFFSRVWRSIFGSGTGVSLPPDAASLFGQSGTSTLTSQASTEPVTAPRPPQLWHVHGKPVAGLGFIGSGGNGRLRFVERSSGYVFEAEPVSGNVTRLTNTLMPKIYEAVVTGNGRVIERSLDSAGDISTFVGSTSVAVATSGTASASLTGVSLDKNILRITTDPRTGSLFYLVEDERGVSGMRSDWNGARKTKLFSSVITHWRPQWLSDGRIILTQAALDDAPGYAYELKSDGTLSPLLRAVPGLTVLPRPSGGAGASGSLLWGQSEGGTLSLFAQVNSSATAVTIPLKTVADKCVWSLERNPVAYCGVPQTPPAPGFLDRWYRGVFHSSDAIWRVDASAGTAELIYTPPSGTSLDVENPAVDSDGNYIAFMNAADKSLWLLRILK